MTVCSSRVASPAQLDPELENQAGPESSQQVKLEKHDSVPEPEQL